MVAEKFANIDLHPDVVDNPQMGLVFEELIRKFAELSNETAGEHFTPREVIRLMVNLIFVEDDEVLTKPGVVRTVYDPAAGTGGMLSVSEEHLTAMNPKARLTMFGQELNPESYAICKADMLIKGQDVGNIVFGNTLSADGHPHRKFAAVDFEDDAAVESLDLGPMRRADGRGPLETQDGIPARVKIRGCRLNGQHQASSIIDGAKLRQCHRLDRGFAEV